MQCEMCATDEVFLILNQLLIHRYRGPPSPSGEGFFYANLLLTARIRIYLIPATYRRCIQQQNNK